MKVFWDCVRGSSGNSFVWETGIPMVMQGNYDPSFTMALHCKDNQLGYQMAKNTKVSKLSVSSSTFIIVRTIHVILLKPLNINCIYKPFYSI